MDKRDLLAAAQRARREVEAARTELVDVVTDVLESPAAILSALLGDKGAACGEAQVDGADPVNTTPPPATIH